MTQAIDSIEKFFSETENLAASGNLTEAQEQLQIFLDQHNLIKARAYNDSGVIAYRQGDKKQALEFYLQAVEFAPQEPVYRKNLADLYYYELGNAQTALVHYRQIIADNPNDFDANLAIGRICADLGKHFFNEAKDFFALSENIKPGNELLVEEWQKLGQLSEAKSESSVENSLPEADPAEAYPILANTFVPEQEIETEKKLLAFIEQYPDFALAYNDLGVISHKLGKIDQAESSYKKAVQTNPDNVTFRKNLADFLFVVKKEPENAMIHYHAVLKNNPKDIDTLMMIGNICLALDSVAEASDFFNLVLDLEPWNQDASQALDTIEQNKTSNCDTHN